MKGLWALSPGNAPQVLTHLSALGDQVFRFLNPISRISEETQSILHQDSLEKCPL